MNPAKNAAVLATSGATTKEGGTIDNSYLFKDVVASFGAQCDYQSNPTSRQVIFSQTCRTLDAAASSWEHSFVSPTFFGEGEEQE